jgi:CRISPR system Cascade subunit CasD
VRDGSLEDVLREEPWQASRRAREQFAAQCGHERGFGRPLYPARLDRAVTVEDPDGDDVLHDAPVSFDPHARSFTSRRVRHGWLSIPTGFPRTDDDAISGMHDAAGHDPFALLGW